MDHAIIPHSLPLSRRDFLKATAAASAAGLLADCRSVNSPTATPAPGGAESPTETAIHRPEIIRFRPDVKSKVVHARHAGVWKDPPQEGAIDSDLLDAGALRQMLDASIFELTGLENALKAWATLFRPDEQIAIKVNAANLDTYWTLPPLALAVTDCLRDADIPAEQIIIFDRTSEELTGANYPVNKSGPGLRCYGTAETFREVEAGRKIFTGAEYIPGWKIVGEDIQLSNILLSFDALINLSNLRVHGLSGITFAMKNHYGTFDRPWNFHES